MSKSCLLLGSRVDARLAHCPGNSKSQEAENGNEAIPMARCGDILQHAVVLPAPSLPVYNCRPRVQV